MKLRLDSLSFGHGSRMVGQNISLELRSGEVLALLGANGAGKTTLFRTILGLIPATSGDVFLNGKSLSTLSRRERALEIAYVPQAHEASFPFTVRDVVLMGRAAHLGSFEAPGARDQEIALVAMRQVGIEALAERPYTEISGGERQITLIARALAQQASIIIMDEPTSSLDYGNQIRLLARIRSMAAQRFSVVLSTHNPDHARLVADRVALLHEGMMIEVGPTETVLTAEAIQMLYGIDVGIETTRETGATVCVPRFSLPSKQG